MPSERPPEARTHRSIDHGLCGQPVSLEPGFAEVTMTATSCMVADEHGLVHGGFVFGLADHAAMLAVNEPTVVLAKAETGFLAPVREGERLTARARVRTGGEPAHRPVVEAEVVASGDAGGAERPVLTGTFHCAVPRRHVLLGVDEASGETGETR